ncbi:MAG: dihydroorotate dehydrogenase-like protein [Rhodothermales bacterium]|nr:dihydroorotate dehydrogenase-like protein [Rhodothermales bacterium]
MMDLSTSYLGFTLKNPIVPSASPLSESLDLIRQMEDAGASAIVMHSLFEEQLTRESHRLDHYLDYGTESFAEALSYFPVAENYRVGPDAYLDHVRSASEACEIPVIGSVNGISSGGWTSYARQIEEAGAAAIELNIYYIPTDPSMTADEVEGRYIEIVDAVRDVVSVPLAVKIGPFFSSPANMAHKLADAGAGALVLFNRFYQPDLDIEALQVTPHLVLSTSDELRLPLRWLAILSGRVDADLAITGGVHSCEDVVKSLMAGANVTMMASELLRNGIGRISDILRDLDTWLTDHEYVSVEQMRGSMSQRHVAEPSAFERANYMKVLQSWRPDPAGEALR